MEREAGLAGVEWGSPEFSFQPAKSEMPLRHPSGNGVADYLSPCAWSPHQEIGAVNDTHLLHRGLL